MGKTRQEVIAQAKAWIGCKESDGSHKKIIDEYNKIKPLPRGYKMPYDVAWCATFISAVAHKLGMTDIIPCECSCEKMVQLAQAKGIWVENDAYVPAPADIILYDWDDNGKGDNTGWSDHVGYVESCDGSNIKVIEGNKNDAVGTRTIAVNGKYIRGFITPKYDDSTVAPVVTPQKPSEQPTTNTYKVKKGDTLSAIAKACGSTVKAIADANNIKDVNLIKVGQVLTIPNGTTPAPTVKPSTTSVTTYQVTAHSGLRIRSAANTSSKILCTMPYTSRFKVTKTEGGWAYGTYGSITGWSSMEYLKKI